MLMNGIFENVIAGIIVAGLSTIAGFLLVTGRRHYHAFMEKLTLRLLERALKDKKDAAIRQRIVDLLHQELFLTIENHNNSVVEYPNQEACESLIQEAFSEATKVVKILTIRGQKYFLSSRSLLYDICLTKREKGFRVQILVLSPESSHITGELAEDIGHNSAERIRRKMRIALENLKHLAEQNPNIQIMCFDETPNFKILMFDDIMFVSSFAAGGPKNDHNAKMYRLTRNDSALFLGLEKYFDDLSNRSFSPD